MKYLYVIGRSDNAGPLKLGISANPDRRVAQLQTGHAEPLCVHHREPVPDDKARAFEQLLHRDIRHLRNRGEWYDVNVDDAIAFIQFTIIQYDLVDDLAEQVRARRI